MNFAIGPALAPAIAASPSGAASGTSTTATAQHRKLTEAAQQFEGMLLQEMLKPMREHGFAQEDKEDGGGENEGGSFGDTLSSFGTEAVATAISKGGGLGIAKRVVAQVEGQAARSPGSKTVQEGVLKSAATPPM